MVRLEGERVVLGPVTPGQDEPDTALEARDRLQIGAHTGDTTPGSDSAAASYNPDKWHEAISTRPSRRAASWSARSKPAATQPDSATGRLRARHRHLRHLRRSSSPGACWLLTGPAGSLDFGWKLLRGPIADGMERAGSDHLQIACHADNLAYKRTTHCAWTPAFMRERTNPRTGSRICRACAAEQQRAFESAQGSKRRKTRSSSGCPP
jgi:hypothetical protein